MTDINDLWEPGDDREPEPCEWYPAPEPIDLEEVEQRLERLKFLAAPFGMVATRAELNGTADLHDLAALIGQEVHGLIAEVREGRRRIAEWEALPTRERWTVTASSGEKPAPFAYWWDSEADAKTALLCRDDGGQLWREVETVHPWEPISTEPPF